MAIALFFLFLAGAGAAGTSPVQELQDMQQTLRSRGYTLFSNAIATSDLQYQILTTSYPSEIPYSPPFTLFAPADELLFALDMSSDADAYVSTLRYHVIPNHRHTYDDLRNLSSPFLQTLLPHYSVLIGKIRDGNPPDNGTVGVMVDAVRLSAPDLFLGSMISVHGIDGILSTGLNMNFQFDRNHNGLDISAAAASAPPPEGMVPPPEALPEMRKRKRGVYRRGGRARLRGNHRANRRHFFEDL